MSSHVPTPRARGVPAALFRLALMVVPVAAGSAVTSDRKLSMVPATSRPYLAAIGTTDFRFQQPPPPPPPDLGLKPAAGGPPQPAAAPQVADVIHANAQAAASTPPFTPETKPEPVAAPEPAAATPPAEAPKPQPPAILPDDTRLRPRPADVLPYFQFPATGSSSDNVNVIVPGVPAPGEPPRLPLSSATYRQQ